MKASGGKFQRALAALGMGILLLGACAPAAPVPTPKPAPAPTVAPAAPAPTVAPAAPAPTVAPAAPTPAPKPAAEQPRHGGVLTLAIAGDPITFDPHTHNVTWVGHMALANYSNLVWYDPRDTTHTRIIGDLATKWEMSPDGTVYTFYLQKGVKFHDGQSLTSADVKFSLERIIFPPKGMPSPRKEDFYAVKGVEATDDYTVKITLKYPSGSFMSFIAGPWIAVVPKHLLEKEGNDVLMKKPLGSGPFIYKSYDRGVSYEMVRNPNYYKPGVPYLGGIKAFIIKDPAARLGALRTKAVLMMRPGSGGGISPPERSVLLKEMGDKTVAPIMYTPTTTSFVTLNNKWKPFQDVRVRRALAMGVDKQGWSNAVFQGLAQVSGPMASAGPWALPKAELETYPGYEPDMKARIAKAKELLAEAGYTKEKPLEVEVSTRGDHAIYMRMMEYVVSELPKIGVKAKAKPTESAAWYADLTAGTFQAAAADHGVSSGDPDSVIGTFYVSTGGRNYAHFSDPKIDELFDKQARTLDPQQRREIVWEIQRILLREAYWPPFGQWPFIGAWYSSVRGGFEGPDLYQNVKYEDVWLAE